MEIQILPKGTTPPYSLLLLADPSKQMIDDYLRDGYCYIATIGQTLVGVLILLKIESNILEIKNIAVAPDFQGKGYGKQLVRFAEKIARQQGYQKLLIGTGNSSIGQLALYQKMGFEMDHLKKNFFIENYSEPIIENGIFCNHMVMLAKSL
ncbi:MAG: GNAT family N-acetyltransferase [Bacteroidota bacterium]